MNLFLLSTLNNLKTTAKTAVVFFFFVLMVAGGFDYEENFNIPVYRNAADSF